MALTDKQEMFCREYLIDLNATQAAIRAGYSEKTAKDIGCQNLAKLNIQEKIAELKSERENRLQIDADEVLREIHNVATARATDLVEIVNGEKGPELRYKNTSDLPDNVKAAISGIIPTANGIRITMHNKGEHLEKLMKHLGLYEADNEQQNKWADRFKVIIGGPDTDTEIPETEADAERLGEDI